MLAIKETKIDNALAEQPGRVQRRAAALTRSSGADALAFFGLAPENSHFLTPDGSGMVNYRLVGNVAVVPGDPVCPSEMYAQVTQSFLDFCAHHRWHAAFYQTSSEFLSAGCSLRLHAFKMGEEAILHPQTFTLSGSAMANVRTSSRRAERDGVSIHWYEGVPPTEVVQQLKQVSSAWLERKSGENAEETGFSTGKLDELMKSSTRAEALANFSSTSRISAGAVPRFVTGVAMTKEGTARAFVTFTPIYGRTAAEAMMAGGQAGPQGWGWSLDLMRRSPDASPGVMELLLASAMERFRLRGAHVVSLGLAAMADTRQEMTPIEWKLVRLVTGRLHLLENSGTLFSFKQKFHPCWQSRYLVIDTRLALPKIALAILRLRNYSTKGVIRLVNAPVTTQTDHCSTESR